MHTYWLLGLLVLLVLLVLRHQLAAMLRWWRQQM
jgi:hypothetical protein